MSTGEVFGWIMFIIFISILFFAAFGSTSITEETVEEYINNLMKEEDGARVKR
tara:strand:- start:1202 stop:1360 length:159 start_codon:yes stop_codon:yes gene_type:complete